MVGLPTAAQRVEKSSCLVHVEVTTAFTPGTIVLSTRSIAKPTPKPYLVRSCARQCGSGACTG
eukprot:scaffold2201_cov110-Isochrysis_galbana.AAC.13